MINVLLVEDDEEFARKCIELLSRQNYNVVYCENAERAKKCLFETEITIAILDLMLPPTFFQEGVELLRHIRRMRPQIRTILITAKDAGTTEIVAEAMRMGAHDFFDKNIAPFDDKLIRKMKEISAEMSGNIFIL